MIEPYNGTKIEVRNADKGEVAAKAVSKKVAEEFHQTGLECIDGAVRLSQRAGRKRLGHQIKLVRQFLREIGAYTEDKTNDGV